MRQYRMLEIATQYDQYLRNFYKVHEDIEELSYDELFTLLMEDCFGTVDFIHRHLRNMGLESKVVFYNNRNLQKKWNRDAKDSSFFYILLSQIKEYSPDVILISNIHVFSKEEIACIRELLLPKKVILLGFHYSIMNNVILQKAGLYDQIYTGDTVYVNQLRKYGLPAYLLRHAFEPDIFGKIPECKQIQEICFLGSILTGNNAHNNRLDMLDALIKAGLPYIFYGSIYGYIQDILLEEDGKRYIGLIAEIAKSMKPGVFGTEYYSVLKQYGICLNSHGSAVGDGAGNMRMFEVTGMGGCLLTDSKKGNSELFEEGTEIVTYGSFGEMVEKAEWLMNNPKKAREIALAGQKKTWTKHTYKNKAECLNAYIQELLK